VYTALLGLLACLLACLLVCLPCLLHSVCESVSNSWVCVRRVVVVVNMKEERRSNVVKEQ